MRIVNPADGSEVAEVDADSSDTIVEKYAAARQAQPAWASRPVSERVDVLRRFRAMVVYRAEDLAPLLTCETGKPVAQARSELDAVVERIDFFLDSVESVTADDVVLDDPSGGLREVIVHEPLGVVANISAWNYPYFVGTNVFVPALLCGNAVMYKPSELASLTGQAIAEMLWNVGVPEDLFALVIGAGQAGAALVDQPVDGLFFTGSYTTGLRIAEALAPRLTPVGLELGGKDPVYVTDDVDVAAAAESLADGAFYNAGQSCCSVERIYVHESVHDQFVDAFVTTVKGFVVGDPTEDATYVGPVARQPQLAVLEAQVDDAVAKGATVLTGGHRGQAGLAGHGGHGESAARGYWFEPTVVVDVTHEMALMRDESFGPIIGIQRVNDDAEALALMNDTDYGLTAGVFCRDEGRARALLAQVDSGTAYWNCCDRVSPRLPWSGRNHSGIGSTLSTTGIEVFCRPKAFHLRSPS